MVGGGGGPPGGGAGPPAAIVKFPMTAEPPLPAVVPALMVRVPVPLAAIELLVFKKTMFPVWVCIVN